MFLLLQLLLQNSQVFKMSFIVFTHHFSQPSQRYAPDSLKPGFGLQLTLSRSSQPLDVFSPRCFKCPQRDGRFLIVVTTLRGQPRPVEIK
jgi:hypothetical protein